MDALDGAAAVSNETNRMSVKIKVNLFPSGSGQTSQSARVRPEVPRNKVILAAASPANRPANVDPMIALRNE